MYYVMGKVATGVATIILTDIIMEKYDVSAKIKSRYARARTGLTRLAAQIRLPQGADEGNSSKEEAQNATHLSYSDRITIWEAGLQLRLARWAESKAFKNVDRLDRAICKAADHHAFCVKTLDAYKRNYIQMVPINCWAGVDQDDIPGDAYDQGEFHYV